MGRKRRHLPLNHEAGEKRRDLIATHLKRMPKTMESDECSAPVHMGLFDVKAVVLRVDLLPKLIQKPGARLLRGCPARLSWLPAPVARIEK